jgi:hypothetical protein
MINYIYILDMSCCGNYIVPGANPENQITLPQVLSFGNNTIVNSALIATAVELGEVTFSVINQSNLVANASATLTTTSNTQYNVQFYLTIDGVKMNSINFRDTMEGVGHFMSLNISGFSPVLDIGSHILKLWAFTNAPVSTISCIAMSINGSANLI